MLFIWKRQQNKTKRNGPNRRRRRRKNGTAIAHTYTNTEISTRIRKTTRILMCNAKWFRCKFTENEDKLHAMQWKATVAMSTGHISTRLNSIDRYGNKIGCTNSNICRFVCVFVVVVVFGSTLKIKIKWSMINRGNEKNRVAWFSVIVTFARYIWQNSL